MNKWTRERMERVVMLKNRGLKYQEIADLMGESYKAIDSILDQIKTGRRGFVLLNRKLVPWYTVGDYKFGHLDIETSNLEANTGFMLCWCMKVTGEDKIRSSRITKKEIQKYKFDRRLCEEFVEAVKDIDILTTYWGTGFDIKFLRTRCMGYGIPYPGFGSIYHFDLYYAVRRTMKLHRNSLKSATAFLDHPGKTNLDMEIWMKARVGHPKSLKYVYDHCIADVSILEELWEDLRPYSKWTRKSI